MRGLKGLQKTIDVAVVHYLLTDNGDNTFIMVILGWHFDKSEEPFPGCTRDPVLMPIFCVNCT